jgi:hypothetical protein
VPCGSGRTTVVRIWHRVSCSAPLQSLLLRKSPTDVHRGLRSPTIWWSYKSYLVEFWMHLHSCRRFEKDLWMLLLCLIVYCSAPCGSGSIRNYLEVRVRSRWVSGIIACCSMNDLHFAEIPTGVGDHCDVHRLTWRGCFYSEVHPKGQMNNQQ